MTAAAALVAPVAMPAAAVAAAAAAPVGFVAAQAAVALHQAKPAGLGAAAGAP